MPTATTEPTGWPCPSTGARSRAAKASTVAGVVGGLEADPAQHRREHDRPRSRGAVGDLHGDAASVGQPHGIHRLGAVLGDEAVDAAHEGGDVTRRAAEVLGEAADRTRDPGLGSVRGGGEPAEAAGQGRERDRVDRGSAPVDRDGARLLRR